MLAEFSLGSQDYYDISVIDGYNVPMDFSCSTGVPLRCRDAGCYDAYQQPNDVRTKSCGGASRSFLRRRSESTEGLFLFDERKDRRSDVENSEDEWRRLSIGGSLKKKVLNASSKLTHSLKKRGKRKVEHQASSFTIEDVRDEEEEHAVFTFQQELLSRNLLCDKQNDYHMLLSPASILGRTGCSFDAASSGLCRTADCGSGLRCASTVPEAPVTRAQVARSEGFYHYGITTYKGFNLPLDLACSSGPGVKARSCWGWPCARSGWPTSTLACTRTGRGPAGASGSGRRSSPPAVALVYLLQDTWNHIVRQEEAATGDERRSETATSEEPSYPANDHKEVAVMP
ncbi:hypothetical protein ZWY2020_051861 [Hordeum vulgare]|nr:hypothetical protein ZWY2020_051861 [Hordeum vulgare]